MQSGRLSDRTLAATITRTASKQTYYTIRLLADTGLVDDAYRAYAYFRWLDDWLDQEPRPRSERLAFVRRQQALIDSCAHADQPGRRRTATGIHAVWSYVSPETRSRWH